MNTFFFWSSGIVGALGSLPYLWGIFKGNVKPHRVSWLIWGILATINFFSQFEVVLAHHSSLRDSPLFGVFSFSSSVIKRA